MPAPGAPSLTSAGSWEVFIVCSTSESHQAATDWIQTRSYMYQCWILGYQTNIPSSHVHKPVTETDLFVRGRWRALTPAWRIPQILVSHRPPHSLMTSMKKLTEFTVNCRYEIYFLKQKMKEIVSGSVKPIQILQGSFKIYRTIDYPIRSRNRISGRFT